MSDGLPYLARGAKPVATDSTVLVSSSRYLNEPRLRDWLATAYLRKSGKGSPQLLRALRLVSRSGLHYQAAFSTALKAERCGMGVGE